MIVVRMSKMIMSPGAFFVISEFLYFGLLGA